jgi:hypothetical protein
MQPQLVDQIGRQVLVDPWPRRRGSRCPRRRPPRVPAPALLVDVLIALSER